MSGNKKASPWVRYKNGNYTVTLNLIDGTKIRETEDDFFDAEMPESMDVKITNRCHHGCAFCHENSRPDGAYADLGFAEKVVASMHPFTEVAVGGGNLMEDPEHTERFLRMLVSKMCVPSITLRQEDFIANIDTVDKWRKQGLVFGIGVSLSDSASEKLVTLLQAHPTAVLHTICGILTPQDIERLSGRNLKILLLGYKNIRRGTAYKKEHGAEVDANIEWLGAHIGEVMRAFKVCSFDNLALEQLPVRETVGEEVWERFYMGDDGQHTFYIDLVEREYAMSSTSTERFPIEANGEMEPVNAMFAEIKAKSS